MLRPTAALFGVCLLSAGCTAPTSGQDLAAQLTGRTLSNPERGDVVTFAPDGTFRGTTGSGVDFEGVWEIENGLYCREVTVPADAPRGARRCQTLRISGNEVTFSDLDSDRTGTWTIQS